MKTRLAILAAATMCAGMGVAGGALAGIPPLNTFPFDHQIGHTPPVQHGNGTSAPSNFTTTIHDRASTPCDDADVADILRGKRGAPVPTLVLPYLNQRVALRGSVICPGSGSRLMPEPDDVFPIR